MCFFKKKKNNKRQPDEYLYEIGSIIRFKYRGDVTNAYVYDVYLNDEDQIVYDLQIGGECPVVIKGILETSIIKNK